MSFGKNYEKMAEGARKLFLTYDQEKMIQMWNLHADENYLYVNYIGEPVKIERSTGILWSADGQEAALYPDQINGAMVLFDLLCYPKVRPKNAGTWTSISGIGGIIGAGHANTLGHDSTWDKFAGKTDILRLACGRLGGIEEGKADAGYRIPIFKDFAVLFQFWDADEEFPANGSFFFDANALQFMHYETLWYVMNSLKDRIELFL